MSGAADRSAERRRPAIWLVVAVTGVALALVLIAAALVVAPSTKEAEFRLELAKAFVQLAVIVLLGGLVAAAIRKVESLREEQRRRHEYWAGLFHDVVVAYSEIKTVRRTLRAYGFRPPVSVPLTTEQVEQFRTQMAALLRSQLALETVRRELQARGETEAVAAVSLVDRYVREIVRNWEDHNLEVVEGAMSLAPKSFTALSDFLGPGSRGFVELGSDPMTRLENLVRAKRRGGASIAGP